MRICIAVYKQYIIKRKEFVTDVTVFFSVIYDKNIIFQMF